MESNKFLSRLVYVYPLMTLVTLFVRALQYPDKPTVASDIQYMDIVAFASAELEPPFARDIAILARMAVFRGSAPGAALKVP